MPITVNRRPITGLEWEAVEKAFAFEAGFAAFAAEKLTVGAVKAAQDLLPGGHVEQAQRVVVRLLIAPVAPHRRLFLVGDAFARFVPALTAIGERVVIQPTCQFQ